MQYDDAEVYTPVDQDVPGEKYAMGVTVPEAAGAPRRSCCGCFSVAEDRETGLPWALRGWRMCGVSVGLIFLFLLLFGGGVFGATKFFNKLVFANFHLPDNSIERQAEQLTWTGLYRFSPEYVLFQSKPKGESVVAGGRGIVTAVLGEELVKEIKDNVPSWMTIPVCSYFLDCYGNTRMAGGTNDDTIVFDLGWPGGKVKKYADGLLKKVRSLAIVDELYTVGIGGVAQLKDALTDDVLSNMALIDGIVIPLSLLLFCVCTRSPVAALIPLVVALTSVGIALGLGEGIKKGLDIKVTGFAPELMGVVVLALSIDFSLFMTARLRDCYHDKAFYTAHSPQAIVWYAYKKVAHNVIVSGMAVAVAFGGLAIIDNEFLRGIALVCLGGVLATLLTTLLLMPALAYFLFPFCFDNALNRGADRLLTFVKAFVSARWRRWRNRDAVTEPLLEPEEVAAPSALQVSVGSDQSMPPMVGSGVFSADLPRDGSAAVLGEATPATGPLSWDRLNVFGKAALLSARWWFVSLPLVALTTGLVALGLGLKMDYDASYLTSSPLTVPGFDTYVKALETFGPAIDTPLSLAVTSASDWGSSNVLRGDVWPLWEHVLREALSPESGLSVAPGFVRAPCQFRGRDVSHAEYRRYMRIVDGTENGTAAEVQEAKAYNQMLGTVVAQQYDSGYATGVITLGTPHMAWGKHNKAYLNALRDFTYDRLLPSIQANETLRRIVSDNSLKVLYYGPNIHGWYTMEEVMPKFPVVIALTLSALFVAILVLFGSVFFAVKMLLTMAVTLVWCFGLPVLAFASGILGGLGPAYEHTDKLYWVIVVLAFAISCALSLDYDVFLIIRILHLRQDAGAAATTAREAMSPEEQERFDSAEGRAERQAMGEVVTDADVAVLAVEQTGPVISYAAGIMTVTFGGLLFANTIMLRQYGVILSLAVLIDAFVVRPVVVPALVAATPARLLWFPRCCMPAL